MSLTVTPDDAPVDTTMGSFWEVSQYKRTVTRIDNGLKLCDDLMAFIKERSMIEEQYNKQLKAWSAKFRKIIEKNSSYHSLEAAWSGMLNEAERSAQLHLKTKENLMSDPYEKVKQWKKDNYHSLTLGGLKETKICNDEFARAQKQWAKCMKKVNDTKKNYYNVCKEERTAQIQENNAKSDSTLAPDKVKKLQELVEKKGAERAKQKDKYESAVYVLSDDTPRYMEDMEKVFSKCQDFEEKRLDFFKDVLLIVHKHVDLSSDPEHASIYSDMKSVIDRSSAQEDLKWWRSTFGPDMPMNWPQFEEYDPERIHMQKSISRGTGSKVSKHVAGGGAGTVSGKQFSTINENSGNGNANRPNSWSDDEQNNPFQDSPDSNPFGNDSSGGVQVRAIYNYDGQEDDELTFSAGDTLFKLEDEDEQGWCKGRLGDGRIGLYPANYVEVL
ncbi:unnamed protein product [Clavelina lepadiformis]|uniref:Protein kinase C and casein kinase substrate in neurons protein 1 n=1 Tax=Clavelina lepadiformis TaxID=159417 RepID=A0ABP0GT13_CLALP